MISSKEVLEKTGISRATLNNYIAMGLLPKPVVRQSAATQGGQRSAPLGFFPDDALSRVAEIDRLKREGYLMSQIVELMSESGARTSFPASAPISEPATGNNGPKLTIEAIDDPAFMVNHNLELVWFNSAAQTLILGPNKPLPATSEGRNIIGLLLDEEPASRTALALVGLQVEIAKGHLTKSGLLNLCHNIPVERLKMIEGMYDEAPAQKASGILERPITLYGGSREEKHCRAYATFFREGILYILKPEGSTEETLLDFLTRRDEIIRALLRKRLPVLTNVAVLVADLQNSVKICSELPPEEYFELINELYSEMAPIFRRYHGTHGKHVGDGLVYYFFPRPDSDYVFNAVCCAQEIKNQAVRLSKNWQIKKNWLNELYLNVGLTEGQEWVGTFQTATSVEFVVLGDTINHAARISDFARFGAIWATKGFLGKLSVNDRTRVRFGVSRTTSDGRQVFVPSSYALVSSLVDFSASGNDKLRDIATFPITEVMDVSTG